MAVSVKTTWQDSDTVYAEDFNRIENNVKEINTALDNKPSKSGDQTLTNFWSFQNSKGVKVKRSISSIWYHNQVMPLDVIINGENSAGMVFGRGDVDKAQLAFNQNGIVLRDISSNTKHTVIHTGNLDLITSTAPATLED